MQGTVLLTCHETEHGSVPAYQPGRQSRGSAARHVTEWLHCVSRRCVLFSAPVQTDSTQFTRQVSKLCTNTRFWFIVVVVKHRCWIWFLALGRRTFSSTLSYVSCVFHSPQASPKIPADRTYQVCLHGFINPAAFDWDELEINDQSRSAGKVEKAIQFQQRDRARQVGLWQKFQPLVLICWSLAESVLYSAMCSKV